MTEKRQNRAAIIDALHRSRVQTYLDAADGDEKLALAFYAWNLQLTSAVQEVLSITEVILRNAIDRELQKWNRGRRNDQACSWLLEPPASPLRSLTNDKRPQALSNAAKALNGRDADHRRHGVSVTHDDVLAQIMFGLWKDLLPNHAPGAGQNQANANRKRLWDDALVHAFPNTVDPEGVTTYRRVTRLHKLRNRVSHMETLLYTNIDDALADAFELVGSISEPAHVWMTGLNRVPDVVRARPSAAVEGDERD